MRTATQKLYSKQHVVQLIDQDLDAACMLKFGNCSSLDPPLITILHCIKTNCCVLAPSCVQSDCFTDSNFHSEETTVCSEAQGSKSNRPFCIGPDIPLPERP